MVSSSPTVQQVGQPLIATSDVTNAAAARAGSDDWWSHAHVNSDAAIVPRMMCAVMLLLAKTLHSARLK
jgi:hypothetical protein